jgi:hypothetical protein
MNKKLLRSYSKDIRGRMIFRYRFKSSKEGKLHGLVLY